jgi:hypothetical protein
MKKILLSSLISAVLTSTIVADESDFIYDGTSVGGQISLFGLGLNVKGKFGDNFGIRAGFDKYSQKDIDIDITDDGGSEVNYNLDIDLQDFYLLGDYHPWKSSFKLVGGLIVNGTSLDGVITPNDKSNVTYTFNNHTYTLNDIGKVNTKVDWDPVAPYIGIGWDTSFAKDKGWGFIFDAGVAFQGSAKTDYEVVFGESLKDNPNDNETEKIIKAESRKQIKNDLDIEMKKLQDDLDDYELLPYISIGVNYKF